MIRFDATRAEVDALLNKARAAKASEQRRSANRTCSSCGKVGHVRGNRVCQNYGTPWRWEARGAVHRGEP